jgi:hypothetical protein
MQDDLKNAYSAYQHALYSCQPQDFRSRSTSESTLRSIYSERSSGPLLSLTKVVTLLLMRSRPQWLSITFLIAGMHGIRILLPLEILGHFVVLALTQILTHAIRGECVVCLLMTRITVVPLAMGPCHLCPLSIQLIPRSPTYHRCPPNRVVPSGPTGTHRSPRAYPQEPGGTGLG